MATATPAAATEIVQAIRRGAAWLIDVLPGPLPKGEAALLALFGLACASQHEARAAGAAESIALGFGGEDEGAEAASNPFLPLLAARFLPANSNVRAALIELGRRTELDSSLSAWAVRQLRSNEDNTSRPQAPSWLPLLGQRTFPYSVPPPIIRRIANDVGALTLFGSRSAQLPSGLADDLLEALRLWVFCCIRDDDLDLLCPLARALSFLGETPSEWVRFILDHQRSDGRFSAQEFALARYGLERPEVNIAYDVYLPLTVASLWTLNSIV